MKNKIRYPDVFYYALIIFLICFDQLSKYIVFFYKFHCFGFHNRFLSIFPIMNKGIAFGYLYNKYNFYYFNFISFILICFFIFMYQKKKKLFLSPIPEVFIIAGGISNFFDRFMYGGVLDFINITIINSLSFPIANFADFFIVGGLLFLSYEWITDCTYDDLFSDKKNNVKNKKKD